jgi:hypothetical protein
MDCCETINDDNFDVHSDEFLRECAKYVDVETGIPLFDPNVAAILVAQGFEPISEVCKIGADRFRSLQESDHWHRGLLRARRERARQRCAAEQRDELAPPDHSITSSARASNLSGTARASVFAALRLMTNWNFVGRMTGKSAGFSPLRIRPA